MEFVVSWRHWTLYWTVEILEFTTFQFHTAKQENSIAIAILKEVKAICCFTTAIAKSQKV